MVFHQRFHALHSFYAGSVNCKLPTGCSVKQLPHKALHTLVVTICGRPGCPHRHAPRCCHSPLALDLMLMQVHSSSFKKTVASILLRPNRSNRGLFYDGSKLGQQAFIGSLRCRRIEFGISAIKANERRRHSAISV